MSNLLSQIDEKLVADAEEILDDVGLDITTAVKIMLKRISKERSASFLLANSIFAGKEEEHEMENQVKMTKSKAIGLLRNKGYSLAGNITFASKNKSAYNYWANPSFDVLHERWNMILNDWLRQEIHLFVIPANAIHDRELVCRSDKEHQIDLQIMYEDSTFTDTRSKVSFAPYLTTSIKY